MSQAEAYQPLDLTTALQRRRMACAHSEVRAVVRSGGVWVYCITCAAGTWETLLTAPRPQAESANRDTSHVKDG
jgi:hypothetical protein